MVFFFTNAREYNFSLYIGSSGTKPEINRGLVIESKISRKKNQAYKNLSRINGTVTLIAARAFYVGNKNFRGHGQPYVRTGCRSLGGPRGRPTSDG